MVVYQNISEVRNYLKSSKGAKNIGLVPTMGALHQGHKVLIDAAKAKADLIVASIFVNPIQFNNASDYEKYPVDVDNDLGLLKAWGCDIVFMPQSNEMYGRKPIVEINHGQLQKTMEGKFKPGHFNGVSIVVIKLLNIIQPHSVFFGQKDLQQVAIIRQLIEDFSFDIDLNVVPTSREINGLAHSSRNRRLSEKERKLAPLFHEMLLKGKEMLLNGMTVQETVSTITAEFDDIEKVSLEYFEIVDPITMQKIHQFNEEQSVALCIAGSIGDVRLIDNILVERLS
ncbi:MAG: pantoate--beta-alanine ligase [Cyclobacteriaceae bacterium]